MNSTSTGHMLVYSNSILKKLRSFQQERFCDSQEQADFFGSTLCLFQYLQWNASVITKTVFFYIRNRLPSLLTFCPKQCLVFYYVQNCVFFSILKVVCFLSGQLILELYSFKYVQKNSVYFDIKCRLFLFCPKQW